MANIARYPKHPLHQELLDLVKSDESIFDFIEKSSLDGIWFWDLEHPEREWMSEKFWTTLGYEPSEKKHLVSEWQDIINQNDLKLAIENYEKHIKDPAHPYDQIVRYLHKSGKTVWVRCRGMAIRDENGKPIRMLGAHVDVTEVHQQKKRSEALLEYSPVCHKIVDLDFKLRYMNRNGFNMLQLPINDAWFGQPYPFEFFPDSAQKQMQDKLSEVKLSKKRITFEALTCDSKGSSVWLLHKIIPVLQDESDDLAYLTVVSEDITDRKIAESKIIEAARKDKLTELLNRTGYYYQLETLIDESKADPNISHMLLLIGIDHFKEVNDGFSYRWGDLMLKEVSRRLTSHIDKKHIIARTAGDEFSVIILNEKMTPSQQSEYIDELHKDITQTLVIEDNIYDPSISIGVASFPENAENSEQLVNNLNIALQQAKYEGGNRWMRFDIQTREAIHRRLFVKNVLQDAVANNKFEIALQPICKMTNKEHVGFEVLLRLNSKEGPISPAEFIPLAEQVGLIVSIGDMVIHKAMKAFKSINDAGCSVGKISINVSPAQFLQTDFVDKLIAQAYKYECDLTNIILEITETALIGDSSKRVSAALLEVKKLGVNVALDDFGTGFSSLSHLRDFYVDKIKLDKSFVRGLGSELNDGLLVEGTIMLAQKLGLDIIAEGVELAEEYDFLKELGCEYMQGYLHSKPLPLSDAIEFIK